MTLLELVKHLRTNILYDTGGTGVDWSGYVEDDYSSIQLRWTNEELTANINDAIIQVYHRTNTIKDFYDLDITSGEHTYKIDSYLLEILKGKRENGKYLEKKSIDDFWEFQELNTKLGEPSSFMCDVEEGYIRFYPIPNADETVSFMVYRLPKTSLSWDNYDASPEIRSDYQIPMLYHAAHLCYLKDEANTLDPRRAADFKALFDQYFPFTSAYSNMRKWRTSNRPIKYGGIQGLTSRRYNYQNRSDR